MVSYETDRNLINLVFVKIDISVFKYFLRHVFSSSKRDNELLLRLIANLNMLLKDDSVNVVKKAILTLTQLYKVTLQVNTLFSAFIKLLQ